MSQRKTCYAQHTQVLQIQEYHFVMYITLDIHIHCDYVMKCQSLQRYLFHTVQVRAIRKKMVEIITRDVTSSDLKEVVNKLLPDSIAKDIEKACQGIYPLHDVYIRKVRK